MRKTNERNKWDGKVKESGKTREDWRKIFEENTAAAKSSFVHVKQTVK